MSLTLDQLIEEQLRTAGHLDRSVANLLKLGKNPSIALLVRRRDLIKEYWATFQNRHNEIMRMSGAATSTYVTADQYSVSEFSYSERLAEVDDMIAELTGVPVYTPPLQPTAAAGATNAQVVTQRKALKLPDIDIPKFDGNPLQWESFRDLYKSLVHDSTQFSQVEKFCVLKSCLIGEAAGIIGNANPTDAGYAAAWKDLDDRYGNPRIISFFHIRTLFSAEGVKKSTPSEIKRLIDTFKQAIRAFKTLNKPVDAWDELLVYILVQKLDRYTRISWETSLSDSKDIPTFKGLCEFLENRIHALEAADNLDPLLGARSETKKLESTSQPKAKAAVHNAGSQPNKSSRKSCPACQADHPIFRCKKFTELSAQQRKDQAQALKLCFNCLSPGHQPRACHSKGKCLVCGKTHNTMLHDAWNSSVASLKTVENTTVQKSSGTDSAANLNPCHDAASLNAVSACQTNILATALLRVVAPNGNVLEARALLDWGATTSFVTSRLTKHLGLELTPVNVSVSGIQGMTTGSALGMVDFTIKATKNGDGRFAMSISALVLPRLTALIPQQPVKVKPWPHIAGLPLADPGYHCPGDIDLILGVDVCGMLILDKSKRGGEDEPIARNTPLGWVLLGPTEKQSLNVYPSISVAHTYHVHVSSVTDEIFINSRDSADSPTVQANHCAPVDTVHPPNHCVSCDLEKFWELEELGTTPTISEDEKVCEEFFRNTHSRDPTGRYVVRLPFKRDPKANLIPMKPLHVSIFLNGERRVQASPTLRSKYSDFMQEYLTLGHMKPAAPNDLPACYLPHHGVLKQSDPNGKIRVVFNASFSAKNQPSLNDCLYPGQKLQQDLWTVLTKWRLFQIAFTTDIVKMFRQISVHKQDQRWQRILWREDPSQQIRDYSLSTVTYGTSCAPFLAHRVLRQLAQDEQATYPLGARVITHHSYVDDLFAGADSLEQASLVKQQLIDILHSGGFPLSKWASNSPELCSEPDLGVKLLQDSDSVSTLGLTWNPNTDEFSLRVNTFGPGVRATKRAVLSDIARLFDPLGWVSPVLVTAKIILQDTWLAGLDWDDQLPPKLADKFKFFKESLPELEAIRIPRWIHYSQATAGRARLHGFCDASERAYAAVVYLCCEEDDRVHSNLLISKTKVAPVKTVSIPRLELCAAQLLAHLLTRVASNLDIELVHVKAWSDSKVVLTWLQSHASKWTPYVSNRVSDIQGTLPAKFWSHVGTKENPADLATRGITPAQLQQSDLWWHGPSWISTDSETSDLPFCSDVSMPEQKSTLLSIQTCQENDLLVKYSSLDQLLRVTSWCLRFKHLTLDKSQKTEDSTSTLPFLTFKELNQALLTWVKYSQSVFFAEEIRKLQAGLPLASVSKILALQPFLDDQGILRLGGRLHKAELPYAEKHPILLNKRCFLSILLARDAHLRTFHGPAGLARSYLERRFWIVHGTSLIKSVVRGCVKCTRYAGRTSGQVMGNLPLKRITPNLPFIAAGVDYAGPILIKTARGRGQKTFKGYISVFVCLVTKAIALEAVSGLTSQTFIAAFRRFNSRRGPCQSLISDNGTTFKGADRQLKEMFKAASAFYTETASLLVKDGVDWTYIPPYTPHMGGLWEAGVKSVKHHLHRVVGDSKLTFEEFSTLLYQIEACLNSRPLSQLSSDPNDLTALTPGHFLTGRVPTIVPEPFIPDTFTPMNRWKFISALMCNLWSRWSKEYLRFLQARPKWRRIRHNLSKGALVLVKSANLPPGKWPLGRIVEVYPDDQGQIRWVMVKTVKATSKQAIHNLCPLPDESYQFEDQR